MIWAPIDLNDSPRLFGTPPRCVHRVVDTLIWRLVGGISASLLIAGGACVWVALRSWLLTQRRTGIAEGVVVERLPGTRGDANGVTIVEFSDGRGTRHRASTMTKAAPHAIGESVPVRYDPKSPEDADPFAPSGSALIFGLVCLAFGIAGAIFWWQVRIAPRVAS